MTATFVGRVTYDTPSTLEYGDYRGWVEIDGETGEWIRDLNWWERSVLDLGEPVRSDEYADLRPVLGRRQPSRALSLPEHRI